jgi:hypothetical protein
MGLTRLRARNVGSISSGYVLVRVSGGYSPTEHLVSIEAVRRTNVTPSLYRPVTSIGLTAPAVAECQVAWRQVVQ